MARRSMGSSGGGGSRSSFSSGGSSRSSFSSSSSYSSSSRGSSHSSHHYGGGWHGGHYHYGPSIRVSGKAALITLVVMLMITASVFLFVIGATLSNYNQLIDIKKADYEYYTSMIKTAQSNPEYQTTATVTKVEYDSEVGGYYFEYEVSYDYEYYSYSDRKYVTRTATLEHSTFACYEYEDVARLLNTTINVALDCDKDDITNSTDTMPMSYINTELSDDAEYKIIADVRGKFILVFVILILAEIGGVIGIVFIAKYKKKSTETSSNSTPSNEESSTTSELPAIPEQKYLVCDYCGDTSLDGTKKCPTCGANLKRKTTK